MWGRVEKNTALSDDGVVVEWLGHNYGVRYQNHTKFLVVPAELSDDGSGGIKLSLWWAPSTKWSTGDHITDEEAATILDATREALQALGFRATVTPVGTPSLLDDPRGLPWRLRLKLKWSRWKSRR
jgi:hypothetical protein